MSSVQILLARAKQSWHIFAVHRSRTVLTRYNLYHWNFAYSNHSKSLCLQHVHKTRISFPLISILDAVFLMASEHIFGRNLHLSFHGTGSPWVSTVFPELMVQTLYMNEDQGCLSRLVGSCFNG